MRERFSLPVGIDNDANAAAIAEWKVGAGHGARDMVMLTLGSGSAAASSSRASPIAAPSVRERSSGTWSCSTGASSARETATDMATSSNWRPERRGSGRGEDPGPRHERPRARRRELAKGTRRRSARCRRWPVLGAGIGSLVNIFDPEVVVIGRGFSQARDLFLAPALEAMEEEALPNRPVPSRVVPALLGGRRHRRCRLRRLRGPGRVVPLAVCATPIGNLEDVTLRVLRELAEAELVLCEDTRRTKILLERHRIEAKLLSYHEHNEAERTAQVLPRLEAGERVALTSDAGLPGERSGRPADRLGARVGIPVTVLPGPSAVETALVASGLVAEQYRFLGYLPRSRRRAALWEELGRWPYAAVAFESPRAPRELLPRWLPPGPSVRSPFAAS